MRLILLALALSLVATPTASAGALDDAIDYVCVVLGGAPSVGICQGKICERLGIDCAAARVR